MPRWTIGVVGALVGAAVMLLAERSGLLTEHEEPAADSSPSVEEPRRVEPGESGGSSAPFWRESGDITGEEGEIHSRFAKLAQRAAPAVVNVHTSRTVVQSIPGLPFPELFRDFFGGDPFGGDPFGGGDPRRPRGPQQRRFRVPSLGTGFVISEDGHIVTNHHVIEGVDEIEVRFQDGSTATASVVGADPKTDLALIQVQGVEDLHALPLGDSDEILPGDWVVAIGNPFGLSHTVTVGIVSAKGRQIGQGPYDDFIQTDAAINPGNSGGPLLNLRGEVVGINTAINPQANTIGFAVPSSLAKTILPQLRESGRVVRGWLGVAIQPISQELEEALELPSRKGALVAQVTPGGPAAEAGIERGDVIVRFDGQPVDEMRDLPQLVAETVVGREVEVEVLRAGKPRKIEVEIGRLEDTDEPTALPKRSGLSGFGLQVDDLTPLLRQRYGIERTSGVLVTGVDPAGAAAAAGIREGDVVVEADREPVESAAALARALEGRERALLLVARGETTLYVALKREEEQR
jgi:serine protease Do